MLERGQEASKHCRVVAAGGCTPPKEPISQWRHMAQPALAGARNPKPQIQALQHGSMLQQRSRVT